MRTNEEYKALVKNFEPSEALRRIQDEVLKMKCDEAMTVGDLRKYLEGVPDDCQVRVQRIEDVYFEKYGWDKEPVTIKLPFNDEAYEDDPEQYSQYVFTHSAYKFGRFFVINPHY